MLPLACLGNGHNGQLILDRNSTGTLTDTPTNATTHFTLAAIRQEIMSCDELYVPRPCPYNPTVSDFRNLNRLLSKACLDKHCMFVYCSKWEGSYRATEDPPAAMQIPVYACACIILYVSRYVANRPENKPCRLSQHFEFQP
jgi:hypothetical protein